MMCIEFGNYYYEIPLIAALLAKCTLRKKNKMIDHLRELSSLETCKTTLLEMFLWKKKLHQHMPEKHFPIYFSWNFSRLMTLIYRAALPVCMSVLTDQ